VACPRQPGAGRRWSSGRVSVILRHRAGIRARASDRGDRLVARPHAEGSLSLCPGSAAGREPRRGGARARGVAQPGRVPSRQARRAEPARHELPPAHGASDACSRWRSPRHAPRGASGPWRESPRTSAGVPGRMRGARAVGDEGSGSGAPSRRWSTCSTRGDTSRPSREGASCWAIAPSTRSRRPAGRWCVR